MAAYGLPTVVSANFTGTTSAPEIALLRVLVDSLGAPRRGFGFMRRIRWAAAVLFLCTVVIDVSALAVGSETPFGFPAGTRLTIRLA